VQRRSALGGQHAVIGHLLLTDHAKTNLRELVTRRHNQVGVIPLAVPVTNGNGSIPLTDDRSSCVIKYDYKPNYQLTERFLIPVELDVRFDDPESAGGDWSQLDTLLKMAKDKPSEVVEKLRQETSFSSELLLRMQVTVSVPIRHGNPAPRVFVRRMSIDWPTITSLRTTRLYVPGRDRPAQVPVSYNPENNRLEWENIWLGLDPGGERGNASEVHSYFSPVMALHIGHPGEIFKEERLQVDAEVEIENYLLSGLQARLFSATGNRQQAQPKLTTKLIIHADLVPADEFAKRMFLPHQQFVFDEIVPNEMRFTDIITVLRNLKFTIVDHWDDPRNKDESLDPKWLLVAKRSRGPDDLILLVAVEGERRVMDREEVLGGVVRLMDNKKSGQLRISVLGMLRGDHKELTREINAFQQALRDRFRFQQTSRSGR